MVSSKVKKEVSRPTALPGPRCSRITFALYVLPILGCRRLPTSGDFSCTGTATAADFEDALTSGHVERTLQVRIRRRWLSTPFLVARGAYRTPRGTSRPHGSRAGTGDTSCRSLPAAGSAEGRSRGPRLTARDSLVKDTGHTGHAWGRHVPATSRRSCDARHVKRGRHSACVTP